MTFKKCGCRALLFLILQLYELDKSVAKAAFESIKSDYRELGNEGILLSSPELRFDDRQLFQTPFDKPKKLIMNARKFHSFTAFLLLFGRFLPFSDDNGPCGKYALGMSNISMSTFVTVNNDEKYYCLIMEKQKQLRSFDEIEEYCSSRYGGHLASIVSQAEAKFLHKKLSSQTEIRKFFVGLRRNSQKYGEETFTDGTSADYVMRQLGAHFADNTYPLCYLFDTSSNSNYFTAVNCNIKLPYTVCKVEMEIAVPQWKQVKKVHRYRVSKSFCRSISNWQLIDTVGFQLFDETNSSNYCLQIIQAEKPTTYSDAENMCVKSGGHLLNVNNDGEASALSDSLLKEPNLLMDSVPLRILINPSSRSEHYLYKRAFRPKKYVFSTNFFDCFLLMNSNTTQRYSIWQSDCNRMLDKIVCKLDVYQRYQPVTSTDEINHKIRYKRSIFLDDDRVERQERSVDIGKVPAITSSQVIIIAVIVIVILNLLGCILILLLKKTLSQRAPYGATGGFLEPPNLDERITRIVERTVEEIFQRNMYNWNNAYRIPGSPTPSHLMSRRYEYRMSNIPRLQPPDTLRPIYNRR